MAMPAMPGAGLVVIEAEFILGGLKTILDGPAMAFPRHQLLDGRAFGTPCGEKGQAAVGDVAAHQKTPRPFPGKIGFRSLPCYTRCPPPRTRTGFAAIARVIIRRAI